MLYHFFKTKSMNFLYQAYNFSTSADETTFPYSFILFTPKET